MGDLLSRIPDPKPGKRKKKPNKIAKAMESALVSDNQTIKPTDRFAVEPKADKNILKVDEYCLYALHGGDQESYGRHNGAWFIIFGTIFMVYLAGYKIYSDALKAQPDFTLWENLLIGGGGLLLVNLLSIHFYIRWRRILPLCFNRATQQVSYWHKGKLWQSDWDKLEVEFKTFKMIGPHVPVNMRLLGFTLYHGERSEENSTQVSILGTGSEHAVIDLIEGGYMIWEYIRRFMEQGKQAVPEPEPYTPLKITSVRQLLKENNPIPLHGELGPRIFQTIILPITIPIALIAIPTDLIYLWLDKALPQRKPPKALREACEARQRKDSDRVLAD